MSINPLELPNVPCDFGWGGSHVDDWLKQFLDCLEFKFENLENIFGASGGGLTLGMFDPILFGDSIFEPTIILNSTNPNSLQNAITNANAYDVIRVDTDLEYTSIIIPADKPLTIFAGDGYKPCINANNTAYGVLLKNGVKNFYFDRFEIKNQFGSNTPGATDNAGGVCLESTAIVKNIILKNLYVHDCSEAGIQFQTMNSVINPPASSEDLSRGLYIINCVLDNCSTNDNTENAGITLYDCRDYMIVGCESKNNLRGINAPNSIDGIIIGNRCYDNRDAGIKLDSVPALSFPPSNAIIMDNVCYNNGNEGIRLDDASSAYVINNTVVDNAKEGIYVEDLSYESYVINNISINNEYGIRIDDNLNKVIAIYNNCYNNSVSDYSIGAGVLNSSSNMSLDIQNDFVDYSNNDYRLKLNSVFNRSGYKIMPLGSLYQQSSPLTLPYAMSMSASRCAFFYNDLKGLTKLDMQAVDINYDPSTSSDWNTTPDNIKVALDELASRVKTLEP